MMQSRVRRPRTAVLMTATLVLELLGPAVSAQQPAAPQPAAATQKPAPTQKPAGATQKPPTAVATATAATTPPVDGGWPRANKLASGGGILIHQPQIASWEGQKHMVAFTAITYRPAATTEKQTVGTIRMEADTVVSIPERLVRFSPVKVSDINFPTLPKETVREIANQIDSAIPDEERVIALDRVLANLDKSKIVPKNIEGLKADPPAIFFSRTPAVIVNLDGEPIWSPIKDNDLKFAVNTNWDLFQHTTTNTYYLLNKTYWLKAADVKGPWSAVPTLPGSFQKLPPDDNWKEV